MPKNETAQTLSDELVFTNAKLQDALDGIIIKPGEVVTYGGTADGVPFINEYAWKVIREFPSVGEWLLGRVLSPRELLANRQFLKGVLAIFGYKEYVTQNVIKEAVVSINSATMQFFIQYAPNLVQLDSFEQLEMYKQMIDSRS